MCWIPWIKLEWKICWRWSSLLHSWKSKASLYTANFRYVQGLDCDLALCLCTHEIDYNGLRVQFWGAINSSFLMLQYETDIISRYLSDYNISAKVSFHFLSWHQFIPSLLIGTVTSDHLSKMLLELPQWSTCKRS